MEQVSCDPTLTELADRVVALVERAGTRVVVGLTGAPGAGKSSVATALAAELTHRVPTTVVPMDGFHLADTTLTRLGLRDRKGVPASFDADGYLALLRRLRDGGERAVFAPGFDRILDQPLAAAVTVPPEARVVLTEGNYLLLDEEPWVQVRSLLDEVWFVELDEEERVRRLTGRHVEFGRTPQAAVRWMELVDVPNARLVALTRDRADLVVSMR